MADLSGKKSNFISNVAAQATALKKARDELKSLAEEYANQFAANQAAALADVDFTGSNAYMTTANMTYFFGSVQPAAEAAIAGQLQGLLAMIGQ